MEKYYVYIVLLRTKTVISKAIQLVKKDDYTHAAISFDKKLDSMYSFGRRNVYNPFIGRFKREEINKGVYRLHKSVPGVILEIEVSKEQYEKAQILLSHFISNFELYKYNYKGLLYSLLNKPTCCDHRFLCSEFVYHILKESGIVDLKISRNLVRPQNLRNLKSTLIYEGNLKDLDLLNQNSSTKDAKMRILSAVYEYILR